MECDICNDEVCMCDELTLDEALKSDKKTLSFALNTVFYNVKSNIIYEEGSVMPVGVITKHKNKKIIISNADYGEDYHFVNDIVEYNFPTVSFACLSRFYHSKNHESSSAIKKIASMIASGKLSIIDYTAEDTYSLTEKQRIAYGKWFYSDKRTSKPCPVKCKPGYSIINLDTFHKPSTVLFREKLKSGCSMLLGMDENQYFGCELVDHPKNIKSAFTSLIPKSIRGKKYKRQGEWFVVEIKETPKDNELDLFTSSFILPIDDIDSNVHEVSASRGGIKDGIIYAQNPTIEHPEHQALDLPGSYYFVKNTAIRSVSQDGVD